jgi:hypothetical protein
MSGLTDEQQARLDGLAAKGWTLVSAPSISEDHDRARLTAPLVMERTWNGRLIRESAHDLDKLLKMTLWQQKRLEGLEASPLEVHTGPVASISGEPTNG